uniref:Sleeping Beauty transposase HTH domain-containing protein n=1 Tax=Oncorhynchus tshawytscha TaxID=74940 RepID=A0AAZ3Q035_ONCTS
MRSKELSVELRDRIILRQRSGEAYKKISAALKVPKNTVAFILKWKKFGTIKTLPRAVSPAKLSNWGRRALVREMTKNPMVTLTELQFCSSFLAHHHVGPYDKLARWKPLLNKRHDSPFGVD